MSAIRPRLPDLQPQRPFPGAAEAPRTSQAAFFQAALGQASMNAAAAAPQALRSGAPVDTPVRAVPARSPLFPDSPTSPAASDRPLRPGALLDIRV